MLFYGALISHFYRVGHCLMNFGKNLYAIGNQEWNYTNVLELYVLDLNERRDVNLE